MRYTSAMFEKILLLPGLIIMSLSNWLSAATPTPVYTPNPENTAHSTPGTTAPTTLEYQDISYHIYDYVIDQPDNVSVHINAKKDSATDLKTEYQCTVLVNGGFYNPDFQPLGLIKANNQQKNPSSSASLLNAYLNFNQNTPTIDTAPIATATTTIQSGPLLLQNGTPRQLVHLSNDAARRRLVAAIDKSGMLHFIAVTLKDIQFSGPQLADLPAILQQYNQLIDAPLSHALNLDGGSASAFLTPQINLTELKPIGSFLCYKPAG